MKKLNKEQFIEKARKIHGDKYDYTKVDYVNNRTPVCIICYEHGEFWQTPASHLRCRGCPKCGEINSIKKRTLDKKDFINRSNEIHNNKYNYDKVEYINNYTPVVIICPIHGDFKQRPMEHLNGCRCPECANESMKNKLSLSYDEFVERSNKIHFGIYKYKNYKNYETKVCIICPIHGEFWQTPHNHLNGCGCPYCKSSNIETRMYSWLQLNKYSFEFQKRFEWLGLQSLDFYLPDYNIAIECQGGQHFKPVDFGGYGVNDAELKHKKIILNDELKFLKCKNNNINIVYYTEESFQFEKISFIYKNNIYQNLDENFNKIINKKTI